MYIRQIVKAPLGKNMYRNLAIVLVLISSPRNLF